MDLKCREVAKVRVRGLWCLSNQLGPYRVVAACVALALSAQLSLAQTLSSLAGHIARLGDLLSTVPGASEVTYLRSEFAAKALGGAAKSVVVDQIKKGSTHGRVKSLAGHLERIDEAGQSALSAVRAVNADLPALPTDPKDRSYCDLAKRSKEKLGEVERVIRELREIEGRADAFLNVLPALTQMSEVLASYWNDTKVVALAFAYDTAIEKTSYGTMMEQWTYWTSTADSCVGICASTLLEGSRSKWTAVAEAARSKREKLASLMEARLAYDQHFYASGRGACRSGDELDSALQSATDTHTHDFDSRWESSVAARAQDLDREMAASLERAGASRQLGISGYLDLANALLASAQAIVAARQQARASAGDPGVRQGCGQDARATLQQMGSRCGSVVGSGGICEAARSAERCYAQGRAFIASCQPDAKATLAQLDSMIAEARGAQAICSK